MSLQLIKYFIHDFSIVLPFPFSTLPHFSFFTIPSNFSFFIAIVNSIHFSHWLSFFFFFFVFLEPRLQHREVPRLGVESVL